MVYRFNGHCYGEDDEAFYVEIGLDEGAELQLNLGRRDLVVLLAQMKVLFDEEPDIEEEVNALIREATK